MRPALDGEEKEEVAAVLTNPVPVPSAATDQGVAHDQKHVLLLEDDPAFRTVMREFLVESGYVVHEAQNGVEGVNEALEGDFSLILCDMLMPGLAGDLFFRAVERARPDLCPRFVFMTGHRGDAVTNAFIEEVGAQTLMKPFRLDQLLEAAREAEQRSRKNSPTFSKPTTDEAGPAGRTISESPASAQAEPACQPSAVSAPHLLLRESSNAAMSPPSRKSEGAVAAKRVLLLEDDASFREIIHQFLTETGYQVREAQSGLEGIKEVLAGDFAVVLCDMQMPALPGDLFYRAVQRARPELCERFIFMTGLRGDATANAFIKSTSGQALLKPFNLDKLLEAIGAVERKRRMAQDVLSRPTPRREPRAWVSSAPEPVASPDRAAAVSEATLPASQPRSGYTSLVLVALAAAAIAGMATWYLCLAKNDAVVSAEMQRLDDQAAEVSEKLAGARTVQANVRTLVNGAERLAENRQKDSWAGALRSIGLSVGRDVELRIIHAWKRPDDMPGRVLDIEGSALGSQARIEADRFRAELERQLHQRFQSVGKCGIL